MNKLFEILSFVLVSLLGTNLFAQTTLADVAMPSKTVIQSYNECKKDIPPGMDKDMYKQEVQNCKELAKAESKRSREIAKEESKSRRPVVVVEGTGNGVSRNVRWCSGCAVIPNRY